MHTILTVTKSNPIAADILKHLREAYFLTVCSEGPFPHAKDREKILTKYDKFATDLLKDF